MAESRASAVWEGNLVEGHGRVSASSGVFTDLDLTWAARTNRPDPKTSPEELIEGGGFSMSKMEVDVHGRVPGVDVEAFQQLAEEGERGCPVSNALRGNVEIVLRATLDS
jgi:osmotically inducible protein OsmC